MLQVYKAIYNQLPIWEKAIIIFWGTCVILFAIYYVRAVIEIIKFHFKKNKPQTF